MALRGRSARWWAVVLAVLALLTVGLGVWLVSSSEAAGIPDEFADRPSLPDCGRLDLTDMGDEPRGAAVDCFEAALAEGAGAELVVVHMTAEGDRVTEYYRALPDGGGVEIFSDNRQDAFRGVDWHHAHCPEARSFLERGDCGYRDL